jgi:hypothetical protein
VTNYSENPGDVRVDRYKRASGKWYDTFSVDMSGFYDRGPRCVDAVKAAIEQDSGREVDLDYWIFVVNDPYHKHSHPIMLKRFEPDA